MSRFLSYINESMDVTDTPAFKRWFGNSKVVDGSGKPLVMYHGTSFQKNIQKFKMGNGELGTGIYFTTEKYAASMFAGGQSGKLYTVYIQANPYELSMFRADPAKQSVMLAKKIIQNNTLPATLKTMTQVELCKRIRETWTNEDTPMFWLIRAGYDAVTDKDSQIPGQIAVFSPTQIKSVFNRGTFDPKDPNINH